MIEGENQHHARELVVRWMGEQGTTRTELASRAQISKSVITRFLAGRNLTPLNASRLLAAIHVDLSATEVALLVDDFGLRNIVTAYPHEDCGVEPLGIEPLSEIDRHARGVEVMATAHAMLKTGGQRSQRKASQLFFKAELEFAHDNLAALSAARIGTQLLVNIGDLDGAEQQCARLEATYSRRLGEAAAPIMRSLRVWVLFDKGDYPKAIALAEQNLKYSRQCDLPYFADDALHMLCLSNLYHAMAVEDRKAALETLDRAAYYGHQWLQKIQGGPDVYFGFAQFRLGQIDALRHKPKDLLPGRVQIASKLFGTEPARHFVSVFLADRILENGDTRKARLLVGQAQEEFESISYAVGMARCARVNAVAELQERNLEGAIEYALLSLALDPWGRSGSSSVEQFLEELVENQRSIQTSRQWHAMLVRCSDRLNGKLGRFELLNRVDVDNVQRVNVILNRLLCRV